LGSQVWVAITTGIISLLFAHNNDVRLIDMGHTHYNEIANEAALVRQPIRRTDIFSLMRNSIL
jgi:hypothetical protein